MKGVVLACALAACTGAQTRHTNRVGLGLAVAALACDWGQTDWAMASGSYMETNDVLGGHPSRGTVGGYMVTSIIATTMAWAVLPERWRPVVWGSVGAVEVGEVASNMGQRVPVCGL